jgi:hypothetical protein
MYYMNVDDACYIRRTLTRLDFIIILILIKLLVKNFLEFALTVVQCTLAPSPLRDWTTVRESEVVTPGPPVGMFLVVQSRQVEHFETGHGASSVFLSIQSVAVSTLLKL